MNNYLQHHGVKGMKWGVRKDRKSLHQRRIDKHTQKFKEKGYSDKEARIKASKKVTRDNIIAGTVAATAVAAAASWAAQDISEAKKILSVDIEKTNNAMERFSKADELLKSGEEFVRASYLKNEGWSSELPFRNYAARVETTRSKALGLIERYGDNKYSLIHNSRSRIAGLQKQVDVLSNSNFSESRDLYLKETLKRHPVAKVVLSKTMDKKDLSKAMLNYINKTGYGAGSDTSLDISKKFVKELFDSGYSAARDTNHENSPFYILLNKKGFMVNTV